MVNMGVFTKLAVCALFAFVSASSRFSSIRTLYVSHYDGHVYTLSFDESDTNVNTSLKLTNSLQACGQMPSWLTLDPAAKVLYCVDESGTSTNVGNGSVSSFDVSGSGSLKEAASAVTLSGGVASVIYEAAGKKFLAIAHYEGSAVSTFALPLTSTSKALQSFEFVLPGPATDPSRQDAPHPHEVIVDPSGKYILSPDLGADEIHIFAIGGNGTLTQCEPFKTKGGNGPRHGAFFVNGTSVVLFVTNELGNDVSVYSVYYGDSRRATTPCLLTLAQGEEGLVPSPSGTLPNNSYVSEIRIIDSTDAYISIRGDQSFAPDDSMSYLHVEGDSALDGSSTLAPQNLTSSFGSYPRTFVISADNTLFAIGNQDSSSIAIVKRDAKTGALGPLLGNLVVGEVSAGLSSVVWDD